jgi:ABC-type uncharacterized transport system substrate-binding protein
MSDKEKMSLAFDILVSADVMREYDDNIWVSIDRESWEAFFADEEQD